jgi:hypothetical protein
MKKEWIKWVVLAVVVLAVLAVIYLKFGIGMFLIGAVCFLAGKFLKWAYIKAAFNAIDGFMTKLFTPQTTPAVK